MNKVVIYGNSVLSQMLYFDSLNNNEFQIACFVVDREYFNGTQFMGMPQIEIEKAVELYPPDRFDMLAVLGGYSCMRDRQKMYNKAKTRGYTLRNYISHKTDVLPGIEMGDNNIIFSRSYIGMRGKIGNNNIIRQQVYLGHDFKIADHNFIGVGCKIGGNCNIKNTCYIAMGSTIINNIIIEEETLIGAGSVVIRNTEPYSKNVGNPTRVLGYHKAEGIKMDISHG